MFTTIAAVFTGKLSNDPLLAHALCIEALTDIFIRDSSHLKRSFLTKIETANPTDTKILLLLLMKRYNLFKVLACSTTFFHLSLLCVTFFQLRTFMLFMSSKTSSSQRILGLKETSYSSLFL